MDRWTSRLWALKPVKRVRVTRCGLTLNDALELRPICHVVQPLSFGSIDVTTNDLVLPICQCHELKGVELSSFFMPKLVCQIVSSSTCSTLIETTTLFLAQGLKTSPKALRWHQIISIWVRTEFETLIIQRQTIHYHKAHELHIGAIFKKDIGFKISNAPKKIGTIRKAAR